MALRSAGALALGTSTPRAKEPLRCARDARDVTFMVGGEDFTMPKPFVSIHSPYWKQRFEDEPAFTRVELAGTASSFRSFVAFLQGAEGTDGEVNSTNVLHLLHWSREFGLDYVSSQCEALLMSRPPPGVEHTELLELSARHGMPHLYSRAVESVAQDMHAVPVPEDNRGLAIPPTMVSHEIREDIIRSHISMGLMRGDGEARRRHRYADHTGLATPQQRARLLWKTRGRFQPPPEDLVDHNWRSLEAVWPHHSMRGDDWVVVPAETQPTMPLRDRGAAAIRSMMS